MRRVALILVLLAVLVTPLTARAFPAPPHLTAATPTMSYQQAAAAFLRVEAAWRAVPASEKVPVVTGPAEATAWVHEIAPYYVTEGIVAPDNTTGQPLVKLPTAITATWYDDPDYALHVVATTGLCGDSIEVNQREFTPGDPWYASDDQLVVLAHELAHINGVCYGDTPISDEASAQLISWEVMAAMSDAGCQPCRVSLLSELQNRTLSALWGIARAEGRQADYDTFIAQHLTPAELRVEQRAERLWAADPEGLDDILIPYAVVPVSAVVLAIAGGRDTIDGVQLPINAMNTYTPQYTQQPLRIDDLTYVWETL